eukprot:759611-Hanusia_phi.AAC.3
MRDDDDDDEEEEAKEDGEEEEEEEEGGNRHEKGIIGTGAGIVRGGGEYLGHSSSMKSLSSAVNSIHRDVRRQGRAGRKNKRLEGSRNQAKTETKMQQ